MDGLGEELVIGIPDILKHFKVLFAEMLGLNSNSSMANLNNILTLPTDVELKDPWTIRPITCPEELELEVITGHPLFYFMENSPEEASKEYLDMLPSKIDPDFAAAVPVLEFLRDHGAEIFNPREWRGINMVPVSLKFKEDMPEQMKPYRPRVPMDLRHAYELEFSRMTKYFYEPSTSPVASPIVVAKKATKPFIRICGDYRKVNKFLLVPKFPIPEVIQELHKIINYCIYIDLDVTNAFHQIPIDLSTSEKLSVQSLFGQFRPKFMPEGVSPASLILMKVMREIFDDFLEWTIVIHDNILLLAKDYDDAFEKLVKVIERCHQRNLILKLSKSRFGVREVEFFGYVCKGGSYKLSDERVQRVVSIPFPDSVKSMQRFLGASMYFKPFIYDYSRKTALLSDMIHKSFNWNPNSWTEDYRACFSSFLQDILNAFTLYHPDQSLDWYLFVDASDVAVGGVLVQLTRDDCSNISIDLN
jgi:hypothetical protein